MNAGYTKLFGDIVTSTIWQEPAGCRVLWITILALKDRDHICRATVPSLAQLSGISIDDCEKWLEKFQKPDKYSRSQEHAGRRIEAVDGGWFVLNAGKYQERMSKEERREQNRKSQAALRERQREADAKKRASGKTIRPEHIDAADPDNVLGGQDYDGSRTMMQPPPPNA